MKKNRKPYSILHKLFYRIPMSVFNVMVHIKPWVLDARKNTYHADSKLKSKFHILMDQLYYAFAQGFTIKEDYYAMGIDRCGRHAKDYIADNVNMIATRTINTTCGLSTIMWHYDTCVLLNDKWIFSQMCKAYGIKTPHVYGSVKDGKLYSTELNSLEDLTKANYNLMVKPLEGFCGWGIFHLRCESGKLIVKGEEISIEKLKEMVSKGRYLIQDYITNQHEDMNRLYPNAVNTLRITVAREADGLRVMGRMGMLGAHGTDCSNWHFGGVSVNLKKDGTLDKYGYCKIDKMITAHPDTGVVFEGYKIPYFDEAIALAKRATECFYGICSIGWDVVITTDGPILLEGNDDWGVVAHQMVEDRGWRANWEQSMGKLNM